MMKRIANMDIARLGEAEYHLSRVMEFLDESYYGYKELKQAHELIKKVEKDYEE